MADESLKQFELYMEAHARLLREGLTTALGQKLQQREGQAPPPKPGQPP
jgi:hypothetical protein